MTDVAAAAAAARPDLALRRLAIRGAGLALLLAALPVSGPLFAWLFPRLDRPLYQQHGFLELTLSHLALAAASGLCAAALGVGAAIFVTRPAGREFRGPIDALAAVAQTFPPVAVLALAAPTIGFGVWPAFAALVLCGLLPIWENAVAGLEGVPPAALEAGRGLGMGPRELLTRIELPLAAPIIIGGLRTAAAIIIGTAAIASTVGAVSLGSPIILGLNGNNLAYVLQGALLMAGLALAADAGLELLQARAQRWREG